jgi:DNA-binding NtrC family response regulator
MNDYNQARGQESELEQEPEWDQAPNQEGIRRINERLESHLQHHRFFAEGLSVLEALAEMFRRLDRLPTRRELDRAYICEAMRRTGANQKKAACQIGITPQALCFRLKKYPEFCKKP